MGSCNEMLAARSSFCLATWEDVHGEVFAITGILRRGSTEQDACESVSQVPVLRTSRPAWDWYGITMVPKDIWLWKVTKTLDEKITGFLKQHFITVSLVWVDEYLDFNATFVWLNNLFFGGGIWKIIRLKYFSSSALKVQSLGSSDISENETWNELKLSLRLASRSWVSCKGDPAPNGRAST